MKKAYIQPAMTSVTLATKAYTLDTASIELNEDTVGGEGEYVGESRKNHNVWEDDDEESEY